MKSAQEKAADDLYEMSKPLARYRDDKDLETLLKERERAEDPMLAFIKKKAVPVGTNGRPKKGFILALPLIIDTLKPQTHSSDTPLRHTLFYKLKINLLYLLKLLCFF